MRINSLDFLRGISIISVILYHLDFFIHQSSLFRFGYLGVDIFFVLSGYFICQNFYSLKQNNPYLYFFKKRIERLGYPILILIIILSPIVFFFFGPSTNNNFFQIAPYSLLFFSNFYYLDHEIEYGANPNNIDFLFHTWSLALELQFYIIFLILIYSINFFKKNENKKNSLIIFLVFFIFSILMFFFEDNDIKVFYSTHLRFWEFALGVITFYFISLKIYKNIYLYFYIFLFTFLLILYFLSLDFKIINILVCFASSIYILSVNSEKFKECTKAFKVYNNISSIINLISFLGKSSYSYYIFHIPIIFLFKKMFSTNLSNGLNINIIFLYICVFCLPIISYSLVERKISQNSKKIRNFLIILFMLPISAYAIFLYKKNIYLYTLNKFVYSTKGQSGKETLQFIDNSVYRKDLHKQVLKNNTSKTIIKGLNNVIIIGNSHGMGIYLSLAKNKNLSKNYNFFYERIQVNCILDLLLLKENCQNDNKRISTHILENFLSFDTIILATRWKKNDLSNLDEIFTKLKKLNKRVIVFSNFPEFNNINNPEFGTALTLLDKYALEKKDLNNIDFQSLYFNEFLKNKNKIKKINSKLELFSLKYNFEYYDLVNNICNLKLRKCSYLTDNGHKIFYDYGHTTVQGAKYIMKKFNYLK